MSTAAVVVTYNRAAKVATVLDHVLAQTTPVASVIVVDNASTDDTKAVLADYEARDERITVSRLPENTGGAGGFSHGMALAYETGADHIWIMDDDAYAAPDALAVLHERTAEAEQTLGRRIPFACSLVTWMDGSIAEMNNPATTWDWGRLLARGVDAVLVESCSFVSVLFPRRVLTKHGLPLSEYFIWFDDMEYTRRVTKDGPGISVPASVVRHDLPVNRGVNFGDITAANIWKFEYGARNEASFRWHYENPIEFARFVRQVRNQMRAGGVPRGLQKRIAAKIAEGVRFDPKPAFPRSVL